MPKIITFFFASLSFSLFSQKTSVDWPDVLIEPDPFKTEYYWDHNDYTKIKQMFSLNHTKAKAFKVDTIYITNFNREGQIIEKTRYRKNKSGAKTEYRYSEKGNLTSWYYVDKHSRISAKYIYNDKNQIIQIQQYNLKAGKVGFDSILKQNSELFYGKNGLEKINGLRGNSEVYIYKNDRLTQKKGGYISKKIEYDQIGNLCQITEFFGPKIDSNSMRGIKKYSYNDENLLICDSILTSANFESKIYQITHYEYYENQKLKKFRAEFANSYSEVEFKYENNRLKTSQVKTNDVNFKVAYLRFPIPSGIPLNHKGILNYKDEFYYDKNGNKTGKKVFVEDELFFEMKFILIPW